MTTPTTPLEHHRVPGDGVTLHVVTAGAGPRVLLMHGFPEIWWAWRHQIDPLVEAGFSVVVPDLRGYGGSDRPANTSDYRMDRLVADAAALVRWRGGERAFVVGHDWGGVIAWSLAAQRPELVEKLAILNAPHPRMYLRRAWRPPQLFKSWYVAWFQIPGLAERMLAANDCAAVRRLLRYDPVRPGAYDDEDLRRYVEAFARPGALKAALSYYRAQGRPSVLLGAGSKTRAVQAKTLVVWGEQDRALEVGLLDGLERYAPDLVVRRLPHASHWVHRDAPDEVSRAIVEHFRGP